MFPCCSVLATDSKTYKKFELDLLYGTDIYCIERHWSRIGRHMDIDNPVPVCSGPGLCRRSSRSRRGGSHSGLRWGIILIHGGLSIEIMVGSGS